MPSALVVGCGFVGSALAAELTEGGWKVWGLKRDPEGLPPGVTPVAADVSRPESLGSSLRESLPGELDLVVYAVSADRRTEEAYHTAYVDGLRNVLDVLDEERRILRRLLFVSSTAVYGGLEGGWVDEEVPRPPEGFRGRILLEGETKAREGGGLGEPGVVLRLGGIYGPGRTSLVEKVRRGEALCPPGGPYYTNRIHRDDAAGILAHLAVLEAPDPVYLGVDRDPAPYCEVLRWLAGRMAVEEPRVGDDGSAARRRRTNKRCSSARIVESGYAFRYPSFRDGYGELVEALGYADAGPVSPGGA